MKPLKILVACEESQAVCKAFCALGHKAFSCDVLPCSGGRPEWHIQKDVLPLLKLPIWDIVIAHPPCTHLAVSGARHFAAKRADGRQQTAINFFMAFTDLPCKHVAIENPVCIMSTLWRKPDQIIQPWQFGHPYTKQTCLWLKGLPKLTPTNVLKKPDTGWVNQSFKNGKYSGFGGPFSWNSKARSKTFPGIAQAMADQWSRYITGENDGK